MFKRNKSKAVLAKTNQNKLSLESLSNTTLGAIIDDVNSLKISNSSIVDNINLLGENILSNEDNIASNNQAIQTNQQAIQTNQQAITAIQQAILSINSSIENIESRLTALETPPA